MTGTEIHYVWAEDENAEGVRFHSRSVKTPCLVQAGEPSLIGNKTMGQCFRVYFYQVLPPCPPNGLGSRLAVFLLFTTLLIFG